MKYIIYLAIFALILWAVIYLIYRVHQQLKGKRGCDSGGCGSCPHSGCRHKKM